MMVRVVTVGRSNAATAVGRGHRPSVESALLSSEESQISVLASSKIGFHIVAMAYSTMTKPS
jgi:hypothetical protein